MILGIGTDIVEVARIQSSLDRYQKRFLDRLFTVKEQAYCFKYNENESVRRLAGRFAAKEALVKALGIGFSQGLTWLDLEICPDEQGKPVVTYSPKLAEMFDSPTLLITISHCKEYAVAFAIWTKMD